MSQTSKTLKKIASGEEYKALVAATEKADYETICNCYTQISRLLEEAQKEIQGRIQSLPRRNKDEDYQRFLSAFVLRIATTLSHWHRLNSELKKLKVMEGQVSGFGSKGDPLVKTPEGRTVIITGAKLKEGEKIRFRVVTEGEKIDFGRAFELTPDFFYFLQSQDTRERIRSSLASIRERLNNHLGEMDENGCRKLGKLLRELEDIRELIPKLRAEESERIVATVLAYRQRLLRPSVLKLAFDFLSREEEREIKECCQGDKQQSARALSAPGLFRQQAHEAVKAELFSGETLRGYSDILNKLESNLDSMNSALALLEFKTGIEEVQPLAQKYLQKMDKLFESLTYSAQRVALKIAEDKICSAEDIYSTIKDTLSNEKLNSELRKVFRSSKEFFTLRGALLQLRAMMGDTESTRAEAALKPYLSRRIAIAFGDEH